MSGDICENKHGGHPCSVAAFESSDRAEVRMAVYNHILALGEEGATADEVAEHYGCVHNRTSPRLSELKAAGLIYETKQRRITRTGRSAAVCVAVKREHEESK